MVNLTFDEVLANDLDGTAAHEAGHFVIAEWAGISRHEARVWRRYGEVNDITRAFGGAHRYSKLQRQRLSWRRQTMMAVAGGVASILIAGDDAMTAADLYAEEMSATDIDEASYDPGSRRC